jgi:hypothetical protein
MGIIRRSEKESKEDIVNLDKSEHKEIIEKTEVDTINKELEYARR